MQHIEIQSQPMASRQDKARRLQRKRFLYLFSLSFCLTLLITGSLWYLQPKKTLQLAAVQATEVSTPPTSLPSSPTPISSPTPTALPVLSSEQYSVNLSAAMQSAVDANSDFIIGISFFDLDRGVSASVNGDFSFTAASTTKLLAAVTFLNGVEKGAYSLSQPLEDRSAEYHLQQMINQSNNHSWDLFNALLTLKGQENYAKSIGINSFDGQQNKITPNDMALLLRKLFTGELLQDGYTRLLLSYMDKTNEESFLPSGLPAGASIFHKYGIYEDNVHDGGIITDGNHRYILAIYTNGKGFYQYENRATIFHGIQSALTAIIHQS